MRRYLLDITDKSSLPNFPGSIIDDWKRYVNITDNYNDAEHDAMSYDEYINFIADAAYNFDNQKMSLDHYEVLAWEGIWEDNDYWGDLTQAERNDVGQNYQDAKDELENRNSDYCN